MRRSPVAKPVLAGAGARCSQPRLLRLRLRLRLLKTVHRLVFKRDPHHVAHHLANVLDAPCIHTCIHVHAQIFARVQGRGQVLTSLKVADPKDSGDAPTASPSKAASGLNSGKAGDADMIQEETGETGAAIAGDPSTAESTDTDEESKVVAAATGNAVAGKSPDSIKKEGGSNGAVALVAGGGDAVDDGESGAVERNNGESSAGSDRKGNGALARKLENKAADPVSADDAYRRDMAWLRSAHGMVAEVRG